MNINELDFDDDELDNEVNDPNQNNYSTGEPTNEDDDDEADRYNGNLPNDDDDDDNGEQDDLITTLLKNKGVDPESVKIADDNGKVEEKHFNDLTLDEQLQILGYDDSDDNYGLEPDEVQMINFMRNNRMNAQSYQQYIANQAVQNYMKNAQQTQEPTYEIDSFSDDELFLLDLKTRIPDLTEEEALAELDSAKENDNLYQRKVNGLRTQYKEKEAALVKEEQEQQQQAAAKQAEEYESIIVDAIKNNDTIDLGDSSITLSEDDMNEIASFILDTDPAGVRHIAKALNDPKTLIGMSWYAMHGQEAFGQVADYYKNKIAEAARYNYQKGYQDATSGRKPNSNKTTTVRKNNLNTSLRKNKVLTINDLD